MAFLGNARDMALADFRPGIRSKAEIGDRLILAIMEIGLGKDDPGHNHPFEQCGIVLEGEIEMLIGDERQILGPMDTYFIPAGIFHGWKTVDHPVRIVDISGKP